MYIGVKSDLFQLGMVLWALATLEDEPEAHRRPLRLDPGIDVPRWYRMMMETCLNENPRMRLQATALLAMFPSPVYDQYSQHQLPSISVDDGHSIQRYMVEGYERSGHPVIRTVTPQSDTFFPNMGYQSGLTSPGLSEDAYYYPPRGRSPPSPLPSNIGGECDEGYLERNVTWSGLQTAPSTSDTTSDLCNEESEAETPKDVETGSVQNIAKQLQGTLRNVSAHSQHNAINRHDSAYTEAESVDLDPHSELAQAPKIVVGETEQTPDHAMPPDSLHLMETDLSDKPSAVPVLPSTALGEEETGSSRVVEMDPTTAVNVEHGLSCAPDLAAHLPSLVLQEHDQMQDDIDSGPNYIHQGKAEADQLAIAVAPPSELRYGTPDGHKHDAATDLTGIGAGYGIEDDFRKPTCSDEDLGIATAATSQNVTSQA